ncbi:MAG: terminase large subunit domain-containing protein [Aestuariivirga sp.]
MQAGLPPLPDNLPLDVEEAATAVKTYCRLRLPDVPGQPLLRDVAADWTLRFVETIFGLVEFDARREIIVNRPVRKFFQLVPKKNAKTTNGAAIMVTALLRNRRPNGEFLLIGPTQQTAELAYDQAAGMIEADPWLRKRFKLRYHTRLIEDLKNGASLAIKSFDARVLTGSKPVGVLIDELHELGKIHYAQKVMTQIEGGTIANAEGFVIVITTQSDEPPSGVFKDELALARAIRDGEYRGGEILPMLYEFPRTMQEDKAKPWENPDNWGLVLPNVNRSITVARLLPKFREAKEKGLDALSIWASQHLNVEIGIAINKDRWAGADYWLGARDPEPVTLDSLLERAEVITAGVDGGGLDDLLGLALCGRDRITKDWLFWHRAWAHRSVLAARKDIAAKLEQFAAQGDLVICEHPTQDIDEIASIMEQVFNAGLFPEKYGIGLDPVGVAAITDAIAGLGVPPELMTAVPQGYKLSGTIKGFERKLMDGTAWHDGSDMMIWCVGNARTELRGSATLITKQVSGSAKIDPLMAGFNAFALMARNPVTVPRVSVSEWIASYA